MIDPRRAPQVKENIEFTKNQLSLFKQKIESEKNVVSKNNTPEAEKSRIGSLIDSHCKKLLQINKQIEDIRSKDDITKIGWPKITGRLQLINEIICQINKDVEVITGEQFNCNLENYKREIFKSTSSVMELFDFIIPNMRNEINNLRRFYRVPSNAANTIIPTLDDLLSNFENQKITLKDFIYGYGHGKDKVEGYNDLRVKNKVFSRYQYYEQSAETYNEFNKCIYDICKAIWPFISEQRSEPEIASLFSQFEEINRKASNPKLEPNIRSMSDIFEFSSKFRTLILKVGKKFSYREEYKNAKTKIDEFYKLQKTTVTYFDEVLTSQEEKLKKLMNKIEIVKFNKIMTDVKKYIEEKTLPFERIEMIFEKLIKKDFNVIVMEKDAEDLTIQVTPHLAEKFGENNLKRINIIIQEIDFWFPSDNKQWLFEELSIVTQKIQDDKPLDTEEFTKKMDDFNKEIETKYRSLYSDQIKLLNSIVINFTSVLATKRDQEKLNKRLMEKEAWNHISSRLMSVKRNLAVLTGKHTPEVQASLASNINKFPFLKNAIESLCQLLYDYSMMLFITYEMADQRSIINMTNILATYNEFHDAKSLWQAFSNYFQQVMISNFYANETKTIRLTQNFLCKNELDRLFPKQKK